MEEVARDIVIEIGGEKAVVRLLWEEAPNLCRMIWENLPLESDAHIAKVCNHEFMIQLPFNAPRENMKPVTPASVGWWDNRQNINIWFGDPGPNGPLGLTALFGMVKDNLEGLAKVGLATWAKPGTRVRIYRCADGGRTC